MVESLKTLKKIIEIIFEIPVEMGIKRKEKSKFCYRKNKTAIDVTLTLFSMTKQK